MSFYQNKEELKQAIRQARYLLHNGEGIKPKRTAPSEIGEGHTPPPIDTHYHLGDGGYMTKPKKPLK